MAQGSILLRFNAVLLSLLFLWGEISCKTGAKIDSSAKADALQTIPNERLPADYYQFSSCEKQEFLWDKRMVPTQYEKLPELLGFKPTFFGYNMHPTMEIEGDELPVGRPKSVHRSGGIAKLRFIAKADSPFTGMWSGAECAFIRLSLATLFADKLMPGAAIKFFTAPDPSVQESKRGQSVNYVAMLNKHVQQDDFNFFAGEFSNLVSMPDQFDLKIVAEKFKQGAFFGTGVYLQDTAGVTEAGRKVDSPVSPLRIYMVPNVASFNFSTQKHDFREDLKLIPAGTVLYTVYAKLPKAKGKPAQGSTQAEVDLAAAKEWESLFEPSNRSESVVIGTFVTNSEFIFSEWADQNLFFKHQRYANAKEAIPGIKRP